MTYDTDDFHHLVVDAPATVDPAACRRAVRTLRARRFPEHDDAEGRLGQRSLVAMLGLERWWPCEP